MKSSDTHHTLPSQEVRDDLLVYVVHEPSRTLIVIACIDEELLAGVFINKRTHLGANVDVSHGTVSISLGKIMTNHSLMTFIP